MSFSLPLRSKVEQNMDHKQKLEAFGRLLDVMDDLREKCPWDRKQTIHSLRNLTIEETYELADAIIREDYPGIREELGDLILHVVFYAKMADEKNHFDIGDVLTSIVDKLIHRHPHIYGDVKVESEEDVKQNWEKLKLREGKKSLLEGVPTGLPAMIKALRLQEKTAQVGFEWQNTDDVIAKMDEELEEFKNSIEQKNASREDREAEFGDLLFSVINLSRYLEIDPETALERTNRKFKSRFEFIEKHAPKELDQMTLEQLDELWDQAKNHENMD